MFGEVKSAPPIICVCCVMIGILVGACASETTGREKFATGYVGGGIYVTKTDLSADIFGDGLKGRLQGVQFLKNGDVDPMGGKIVNVAKGTKIRVSQVLIQRDRELGVIVRIFATVVSGPYSGTDANIYGISIQRRGADGLQGMLSRDPTILEPVRF